MVETGSTDIARGIVWNLEELYGGDEDPGLDQDLRAVREKAESFVVSHKGTLNEGNLSPQKLLLAIREYESIQEMGMKPYTFAYLYQSSNVLDHRRNRVFQKVKEAWNEISQMLTFFMVEIVALPEVFLEKLAKHKTLLNYRHFLLHIIQLKPFTFNEREERLIRSKNLSGREAFESVYDEIMGSLSSSVKVESLLHSPERVLREKAFRGFLEELEGKGMVFKHILNNLIMDHHLEDLERGYVSPMQKICLSDGVDETVIETMMRAVEDRYPLARRYFRYKARLLELERLKITDLLAPLKKEEIQIEFSMAKELVLEALETIHPLFHNLGNRFFEKKWIDAGSKRGKKHGAFCKCFAPSHHPFVSMHYSGNLRDLMVLAHELGHGMHYLLAAKQSYLNFDPSPTLAETAATFNEILLTQYLIRKQDSQIPLSALLSSHLEGIFITVYRQNVLTRFEQAVHRQRQDHLLGEEEICQLWWEHNYRLYGEDVEMIPAYRWGWSYIPHFIHRPFYCYSYVFGNLLSMILYQNYKERGRDFLERIVQLLKGGSSQAPLEMLSGLALDPRQKSFWEQAFLYVEGVIDALEAQEKGWDS